MKWDSSLYDRQHSFVFNFGKDLLGLLNAQAGERIITVKCIGADNDETIVQKKMKVI